MPVLKWYQHQQSKTFNMSEEDEEVIIVIEIVLTLFFYIV